MIDKLRQAVLRKRIGRWAGVVLRKEADGAEMPDPESDEEDEFMRETLRQLGGMLTALRPS